ncbi:MAG: hypothetical protein KatS3mg033_2430 [Thermonema sp.]|uniref:hypothetical protein n=1 Tax=Thermonema sp. TaxID=2231181 RepID=UPI0021DCF1E8|nr:hypothetical protein [Thermonema sp.]GIV40630.1 MAG: hypothetical protein KatS3mg033_2430 [Thermonema sp.]
MVFILILILSILVQIFFPWWSMAVVCFVVAALFGKRFWGTTFSAFLAVFFIWAIRAFFADLQNDQLLSRRIAAMLGMPQIGEWLFLVSALLGGIVAFMAAWSGYATKRLFKKKVPKRQTAYRM